MMVDMHGCIAELAKGPLMGRLSVPGVAGGVTVTGFTGSLVSASVVKSGRRAHSWVIVPGWVAIAHDGRQYHTARAIRHPRCFAGLKLYLNSFAFMGCLAGLGCHCSSWAAVPYSGLAWNLWRKKGSACIRIDSRYHMH